MRLGILLVAGISILQAQVPEKPKEIRVSTWVREDIFSGFLEGDMARFGKGEQKLERILAANPKAGDALAWRGGVEMYRAVLASEAGDVKGFESRYAKAKEYFDRAAAVSKEAPQYAQSWHAVTGGSYAVFSDRLPGKYKREGWQLVREHYSALRELQQPDFDKFPTHFRGEIMAGLAQAAQRLGEEENAKKLTAEVVAALPNTPYAVFGKRWLDKPETMAKSKITCSSCHDAGRLQAALDRLGR